MNKIDKLAEKQMAEIVEIYFPWFYTSDERIQCVGTLINGKEWNAQMPLGAAVEVERAGYDIRVM